LDFTSDDLLCGNTCFLKTGFHAVYHKGTMPRFVIAKTCFFWKNSLSSEFFPYRKLSLPPPSPLVVGPLKYFIVLILIDTILGYLMHFRFDWKI